MAQVNNVFFAASAFDAYCSAAQCKSLRPMREKKFDCS